MKTSSGISLFRDAAAGKAVGAAEKIAASALATATSASTSRMTNLGRQAIASALMLFLVPLSIGDVYAQDAPPPPPPDYGAQQGSAYQPLPPEELNRLVAPIALYPDSLVAQVLAASTYPAQVAAAEQFVQQSGGTPPEQLAQMADQQPWDPSVKALTAFPQVLENLNQNIQWATQLGNAYYNQPQDVMSAVQAMRQNAYAAGNLRPTEQLNVQYAPGAIVIEPVSPEVVYVPYYNPWVVYGAPIEPWGYYHYYGPPRGIGFGAGLAIGFGVGIAIGAFGHFGWGFHSWAPNWGARTVVFNHNTYISNSVTVVNHGNYGGFDRNPQARAFNHVQAAQFANVNHTTINNVSVNRTNVNNTNINNRTNVNANNRGGGAAGNAAYGNPRSPQNFNRTGQPSQLNNNGARPGQPGSTGQLNTYGARPGQTSAQAGQNAQNRPGAYQRTAQTGQFNNGSRPVQQNARPAQTGQFNQAPRPAQTGQFNQAPRPAAAMSNTNRGGQAAVQHQAPQPRAEAQHAAAQPHESHGGGESHGHDHR